MMPSSSSKFTISGLKARLRAFFTFLTVSTAMSLNVTIPAKVAIDKHDKCFEFRVNRIGELLPAPSLAITLSASKRNREQLHTAQKVVHNPCQDRDAKNPPRSHFC